MRDGRIIQSLFAKKPVLLAIVFTVAISMLLPSFGIAEVGTPDEVKIQIDGDWILSYDDEGDLNNAYHPSIGVTPTTDATLENGFAAWLHCVWDEVDEQTGWREIHYSQSDPNTHGTEWSNDEASEGDMIISWAEKGKANYGDAVNPSITIDTQGIIHVIWAEQYDTDDTWEIHYSRSVDNGKSWTGELQDMRISQRRGEGDAFMVSPPQIGISSPLGAKALEVLHAVWTEVDNKGTEQEVYYSRSTNGGDFWTGTEVDFMISDPVTRNFAYEPCIATSGEFGENVHVAYRQIDEGTETEEIYYVRNRDYGNPTQELWEDEYPISWKNSDGMLIQSLDIAGYVNDVHVVWSQEEKTKAPPPCEVFYSGSLGANGDQGSWTGMDKDLQISATDGYPAENVSVATNTNRDVHVVWTEVANDESEQKSVEVHTSYTDKNNIPEKWSAQEKDYILSWPDPEFKADVNNVSIAMGRNEDGKWKTQIVWDEINFKSGKGDRAEHNTEIHDLPEECTLSISTFGSGSVSKNPDKPPYVWGTDVQLTANPSVGWYFDYWGGDLGGSTNPDTITMDGDKSVSAYFTQYQYTLSTDVSPVGKGSVTKTPDWATYTHGTDVDVEAFPIPGWEFSHWTGSLTSSDNPDTVYMNGNKAVTANFVQITYDIPVQVGWNFISTPLVPLDTSVPSVLSDLDGDSNWTRLLHYDGSDSSDHWKSYYTTAPALADLNDLDEMQGAWLYVPSGSEGDSIIKVTGEYPTSTGIPLSVGWNLVGYPSNTPRQAQNTLPGWGTTVTKIGYYNDAAAYDITETTDGTTMMSAGNAYWVYSTAATTWNIDW